MNDRSQILLMLIGAKLITKKQARELIKFEDLSTLKERILYDQEQPKKKKH